ncbi:single hybrid motif-containing protein [Ganoderma leucocontextum]|nr:single hybrid motif-containing protein [Ganoderma leucocontextum]
MQSFRRVSKAALRASSSRRSMRTSAVRNAVSKFAMPAMSPTMTEGAIASWKKQEGESFQAGDVLLEIETDKATIDVEAQEDGVLGKILAPDGAKNVPVGKTIGLLAEEGDDISNLEQHVPHHSRPLFPSVLRLIQEHNISQGDVNKINGTGVRGMLTKGDVLTHLGLASGPSGTYRDTPPPDVKAATEADAKGKEATTPLDGLAVRRLIVGNMLDASMKARATAVPKESIDFDSVIADYLPPSKLAPPASASEGSSSKPRTAFLDGLL